jgi:hypothetical protein
VVFNILYTKTFPRQQCFNTQQYTTPVILKFLFFISQEYDPACFVTVDVVVQLISLKNFGSRKA